MEESEQNEENYVGNEEEIANIQVHDEENIIPNHNVKLNRIIQLIPLINSHLLQCETKLKII